MEGIINLLKTPGMTSHDCINSVRRLIGEKRVGHTGTLDPMASGVLPICVGKATRLAEYSLDFEKAYRAEMLLGLTSDTQDITGELLSDRKVSGISEARIVEALDNFVGPIEQITPAYSAVKYQGKKLYELARKGIPVPEKPRNIFIHKLSLFRYYPGEEYPRVIFDVVCSKGTYVRTLCSDLGSLLGTGAVMSFLVRTASGPFFLEDTVSLGEIERSLEAGDQDFLMSMEGMVKHLPRVELKAEGVRYIENGVAVNGQLFEAASEIPDKATVRLKYEGRLVGIGTFLQGMDGSCLVKPKKVLT